MRSEWIVATLDDVCTKITDGAHNSPKSVIVGMPMASVKDLTFYGVDLSNARLISAEEYDKLVKQGCRPEVGDVLIAKDGNTALDTVCVVNEPLEAVMLSSVAILRPNSEKLDAHYLKYYFCSKSIISYLKRNFISGAAIPRVVLRDFKKAEIRLPSLDIQKKISFILRSLDDKIELNRKMNQTLEEMAQALFKSWFVDFDPVHARARATSDAELEKATTKLGVSKEVLELFPSEFVESEMGMIPKGWEIKPLKEIGNVITGKTPPTKKAENYGEKYPFITIPDMHGQTYIINTSRYLSETGHLVQENKLIPKDSLIVSCIATVGLVSISTEDSHTNQQINNIVCDKKYLYFLYCMLSNMTHKLQMYGSAGTTTLNINKSTFESIEIIVPKEKEKELEMFLESMMPLFNQIQLNTEEIQTLQKTRDTLLPKLLSGELDVSNINTEQNEEK